MEKKMFDIKYEVIGGKRNDVISFYAKSVKDVIKMFENHEHENHGLKFRYNKYSIISIN